MADNEGWTVVRGKKGRTTAVKRPRDECCPGEGWEPSAAGAGSTPCTGTKPHLINGHGHVQRHGRRGFRERTAEEQCAQLVMAVLECRREVEESAFFRRLLCVLAEAVPYLSHLAPNPAAAAAAAAACSCPTAAVASPLPPHGMATGLADTAGPSNQHDSTAAPSTNFDPENRLYGRIRNLDSSGNGDGDEGAVMASAASGEGLGLAGEDGPSAGGAAGGALAAWRCVRAMVVYGLGSPHDSRVSRYQLALTLLLRDRVLRGLTSSVQLYDPAFDDVDRLALAQLGLQALDVNEGGARRVAEPTFFYLPHCEGALCDALLGANWGDRVTTGTGGGSGDDGGRGGDAAAFSRATDGSGGGGGDGGGDGGGGRDGNGARGCANSGGGELPQLAILGNSFKTYQERWELQRGGGGGNSGSSGSGSGGGGELGDGKPRRPGRIIRCCEEGAVRELPTPDLRFPAPSAFNDMSLHVFPPSEALTRLTRDAAV